MREHTQGKILLLSSAVKRTGGLAIFRQYLPPYEEDLCRCREFFFYNFTAKLFEFVLHQILIYGQKYHLQPAGNHKIYLIPLVR